MYLKYSL